MMTRFIIQNRIKNVDEIKIYLVDMYLVKALPIKNGFSQDEYRREKINLEVLNTEIGLFLDTVNREYDGILLPKRYVPKGVDVGDFIDVFIYRIPKIVLLPLDWSLIFALVNLPIWQ